MPDLTDAAYLRGVQYRDASSLEARVRLHARSSIHSQGLHRWVFDHLELPAQTRLQEAGCVLGYLWREHADRPLGGWRPVLSGRPTAMAWGARRRLAGLAAGSRVLTSKLSHCLPGASTRSLPRWCHIPWPIPRGW